MGFIKQFGLDWWLIYAQVVNFGVLIVILTLLFYKPILREFEKEKERRQKLASDEAALQKLTEQKEKDLKEAHGHARKIIAEAETIARDIRKTTQNETQSEKRAILAQITAHAGKTHNEKDIKSKK